MKTKSFILLVSALLFSCSNLFAQSAGNWLYNQSNNGSATQMDYNSPSKSKARYDESYEYKSAGNYQTTTPYYGYYSVDRDTVIELETRIMMNVKADSYSMILGVEQISSSVDSCHTLINNRIDNFIKNISKYGINPDQVYVDFTSQFPIYEIEIEKKLFSKSYNEIPKGFEVNKNIHITYRDEKIAEKLLIEAAKNEIYDIVKVDYIVKDLASVYDSMRNVSIGIMNEKIKEFSKLNIKWDNRYHTISEDMSSNYPIERYSSYTSFNNAALNVSNGDKSGSKRITSSSKNHKIFYNKIPYNLYDKVINPVFTEPVVQFTYTLKSKYVLKKM